MTCISIGKILLKHLFEFNGNVIRNRCSCRRQIVKIKEEFKKKKKNVESATELLAIEEKN